MPALSELLVAALLLASGVIVLVAALGLWRLPDFFLRMHAPALASTLTNTVSGLINGTAVSGTHSFTNVAQACWVPQASNPNPVPALDAKAMAMLSLLLAALGWAAIRRRSH